SAGVDLPARARPHDDRLRDGAGRAVEHVHHVRAPVGGPDRTRRGRRAGHRAPRRRCPRVRPAVAPMAVTRIRIVLITAMCVVLGVVAGDIFDRLVVGLLVPPIVCGVTGLFAVRAPWKLRFGTAVLAAVVGVVAAVVVDGGSPNDAVSGPLRGPRRLLTTEWPTPDDAQIVAAVALLLAVVSA